MVCHGGYKGQKYRSEVEKSCAHEYMDGPPQIDTYLMGVPMMMHSLTPSMLSSRLRRGETGFRFFCCCIYGSLEVMYHAMVGKIYKNNKVRTP